MDDIQDLIKKCEDASERRSKAASDFAKAMGLDESEMSRRELFVLAVETLAGHENEVLHKEVNKLRDQKLDLELGKLLISEDDWPE